MNFQSKLKKRFMKVVKHFFNFSRSPLIVLKQMIVCLSLFLASIGKTSAENTSLYEMLDWLNSDMVASNLSGVDPDEIAYANVAPRSTYGVDAALGLLVNTGNTDTSDFDASVDAEYAQGRWDYLGFARASFTATDGDTTSERYMLGTEARYALSIRDILFATLRYEFSAFGVNRNMITEAVGYGRILLNTPKQKWLVQGGPGGRHRNENRSRHDYFFNEFIAYMSTSFQQALNEQVTFNQIFIAELPLIVEGGDSYDAFVSSETSLRTNIIGNLASKIGFTVEYNSNVNPGQENIDTITTINLIYSFK